MRSLTCTIRSAQEAEDMILRCEHDFTTEITEALEHVFDDGAPKLIALAGPTCAGKTTTASLLTARIAAEGDRAVVLSIDDFFYDRADRNVVDGEVPDYDSVAAIDLGDLARVTASLLEGRPTLIPHYSFRDTGRVGYDEYYPDPHDIYVFEGIQAVYPEVTSLFQNAYKSIFISVTEDVSYRDVTLASHELRLMRRLVRDYRFRGATAEFTLHLWEGVRSNEERHIFPNATACDVYINSFLPYEPFILAPLVRELLATVPADSRYRDEADALNAKLTVFDCPYFDSRMIPATSVFREFIG